MVSVPITSFEPTPGVPEEARWEIYPVPDARPRVPDLAVTTSGDEYVEIGSTGAASDDAKPALSEEAYPVLARIWDNEADAVYDDL